METELHEDRELLGGNRPKQPELNAELDAAVASIGEWRKSVALAGTDFREMRQAIWNELVADAPRNAPIKGQMARLINMPALTGPWRVLTVNSDNIGSIVENADEQTPVWHLALMRDRNDDLLFDDRVKHMADYKWCHPFIAPSVAIGGRHLTLAFLAEIGQVMQPTVLDLREIELSETLAEMLHPQYGVTDRLRTIYLSLRDVSPAVLADCLPPIELQFIVISDADLRRHPKASWTEFLAKLSANTRVILRNYVNAGRGGDMPENVEFDPPLPAHVMRHLPRQRQLEKDIPLADLLSPRRTGAGDDAQERATAGSKRTE